MFNSFEYFSTVLPSLPELKKIYRISGVGKLEELLQDLRNLKTPCLVVNDSGDGFLNLLDRHFNSGYHQVYVFVQAKAIESDSRLQAKRIAFNLGVALFDRMKEDSMDYGDPAFGVDLSRIDHSEIGPLADECYGHSFGFTVNNEF